MWSRRDVFKLLLRPARYALTDRVERVALKGGGDEEGWKSLLC